MGQGKSKPPPPMKLPPVPKDSPLGFMLAEWKQYPGTRDKDKAKMIHYCIEVWGGKEISRNVFWPVFGSSEDWVRQKLNLWVNTKTPFSQEESDYASIWVKTPGVFLFNLKEKPDPCEDKKRGKREEEVPLVPPPYVPPHAPPLPDNGTAYGVLTQDWAGKKKPVGYLSKLLDPVSKGWPTCLQAVVACALLTEEAHKITFNSELKVLSPHNIRGILQQKADKWITDSRLLKYEGILLDSPKLTLEVMGLQNPAQFLYGEPDEKELAHNCMTTIEEQTKIRPDLEEEELETGERLFVDGSSRVIKGKRVSGYAIIGGPELEVIESGPLNKTWSAQACELYAVLRALERLKDKEGTIYTDSKYAFGVAHTFGKIWEERGLMNSQGKDLIHQELIKRVLIALRKPKNIAVVHLRGHQRGIDFRSRGNNAADQEAKKAALMIIRQKEKGGPGTESLDEEKAEYRFTKTEEQRLSQMGICKDQDGKWKLSDGREVLPKAIALEILHRIHEKTHWGTQVIVDQFGIKYMCIGIHNLAKQVVARCTTCLQVNKASFRKQPLGGRPLAQRPFANIQVDFTELPKVGRVKYLLVIIDHLTHYVEAFPTTRATTQAVVKVLLENIIPRYGAPETIDSDRGPHFVSKILNETMESLGIKWEHHTPWHPQSSGRVERMNGEMSWF
ncbi:hypothetical protein DUI87_03459 [Hirundo rustica rustica]|uniref:Uncharacterized protein n=1 Tax=Hirundo rustica rustica TaxID=333673 RepID=A0A3M0L3R3_HIRRU|nr:hypothetical protein DUI87_03459 [Hirundo rustica rustica]